MLRDLEMSKSIHPTALVSPKAELADGVVVGPYAVIEEGVCIGPGTILGPFVHIRSGVRIGAGNKFHTGCVIGDDPQDLKYRGEPTRLLIGDRNVFREHVTVHRSNCVDEPTIIGSDNLFMAHSHVGHNCYIGNGVIVANGALLGGHVTVEDRAFISGNCLVHQFVRVGELAIMQGGAAISLDLPPYTVAWGDNGIVGLNTIGLRRAGIPSEDRLELRRLYHLLFLSGAPLQKALQEAQSIATNRWSKHLINFLETSRRGFCRHVSRRRGSHLPTGE